ncbi:DDE_3 domain-containing protein [Trichonephila clavipes]|nr:DDE_3 domain-containing protein [Trichonephila clavipes]
MEWPARSPDLSLIEHLSVYLGREVAALNPPPRSLHELKQGLLCVWSSLPIRLSDNLINSMGNRCRQCIQWIPSHVGIPGNKRAYQTAKQGAESTQPEVPLTLRRAKSVISVHIDKYTAMTQKTKSFGKPWETVHCGLNLEAPGESRGCCSLSPNYRT